MKKIQKPNEPEQINCSSPMVKSCPTLKYAWVRLQKSFYRYLALDNTLYNQLISYKHLGDFRHE